MSEPLSTVPCSYSVAGSSGNADEGIGRARRVAPDMLFLEGPARLDRVKVRRVRRLVDESDAAFLAGSRHSRVMMCPKVVHYEDVPAAQPGEQPPLEPLDKSVGSGGGELRALHYPSFQANRSEEGEILAPVHGTAVDVLAPLLDPSVTASHGEIEPGFVQEDEFFNRNAPDLPSKGRSLQDYVWSHLLQWAEPFFLTTYPARYRARLMLDTWRRFEPRRCRLYSAVISPAFASPNRSTMASSSTWHTSDGVPPRLSKGRRWPSRRSRVTQRFTVASPRSKRSAKATYDPSPASYAATTRSLSSIGYASAIPNVDQNPIRFASKIDSGEHWG